MSQSDLAQLLIKAEKAEQAGELQKARQFYTQALTLQRDHQGALLGVKRLDSKDETEKNVRDLMEEADGLLAKHDYAGALSRYRQALNHAGHANILKYHATLEGKISEARELDAWKKRVDAEVAEAQQRSKQGEADLAELERLRNELPPEAAYAVILADLDQAIEKMDEDNTVEELFQKAQRAYSEQDYERTIELLKKIPPGLSSTHRRARHLLRESEDQWLRYIQPSKERIEALIGQGNWADAFAELDLFKEQFPQSPVWQRLWLQTGMKSGEQALLLGREANTEGNFKQAISRFEEAGKAFAKVLEVYQSHSTANHLQREALELIQIASFEQQAQQAIENGQRRQASTTLQRAQRLFERARQDGREYASVAVIVETMAHTLAAEIELIEQQEQRLLNGQRLLGEKRLDEAAKEFKATLNALLPAHQEEAKVGLGQAENQLRAYQQEYERGRKSGDLASSVEAYQKAVDYWPYAPQMPTALVSALLAAAEQRLAEGRETEVVAYCTRALALDPDNEQAKLLLQKPGIQAKVQAALEKTARELNELNQRAEVSSQDFHALQVRLRQTLIEAQQYPELTAQIEELLERVQRRYNQWTAFEQGYSRAQRLKESGEWEGAVRELEAALQSFAQTIPGALSAQLGNWRGVLRTVQNTLNSSQALWEQAQEGYEQLSQEGDYEQPLVLLAQLEQQLTTAAHESQRAGGQLPTELVTLRQQVSDLQKRVETARSALIAASPLDGLTVIREGIRLLGSDATLQALELDLNQRMDEQAERLLQRAETLLEAGDLSDAVELLRRIHELQPDNQKIANRFATVKRRERLEEDLRQVQRDAQAKQGTSSLHDARDALRGGINLLLAAEGELPNEARQILLNLIQLGDQEEGLALSKSEHWETARELLGELVQLQADQQRWAVLRAYQLAQQWGHLAHEIALKGEIRSATQLGDLRGAYRAAAIYVRAHPTEMQAVQELAETREALLKSLNDSAGKRLERAQKALERGEYQLVLGNVTSLEEEIYGPVEQEFAGILDNTVEEKRVQAEQLRAEAEELKELYEQVIPHFDAAEGAFVQGRLDDAEAKLQLIPPLKEAPFLARKVEKLRANIHKARQEQSGSTLRQLIVRAQTTLVTATTTGEIENLLRELETLPQQIDLQYAPPEEQNRYYDLLDQVRERQQAQQAGATWETQAQVFLQQGEYIKAENALKKVLAVTREGSKRVFLQVQLDSVQEQAAKQRHLQEAVRRGRELLIQRDYVQARRELRYAQDAGAEVKALLSTARAGVLLEHAKRVWQEEQDAEGANDYLEEALELVEAYLEAEELQPEIRRCQKRIKRERAKEEQKRTDEAQERQRKKQEQAQERQRQAQEREQERKRQAQEREQERRRTQLISEALHEARRALATGDLTLADQQVRAALKEQPTHKEARELQAQVQQTLKAQELYREAEQASEDGEYQKAQALIKTIINHVLSDYAPALTLQKQLDDQEDAIKALIRAENLASASSFYEARQMLDKAVELGAERERVRQVRQAVEKEEREKALLAAESLARSYKFQEARQTVGRARELGVQPDAVRQMETLIERLERGQETEVIHPIRDLYRDGKYREALDLCAQALEQAAFSGFRAKLERLQTDIVNRWSDKILQQLRLRFYNEELDEQMLSGLMTDLERLELLEPKPAPHLQQQISQLRDQVSKERLTLILEKANGQAGQEKWEQAFALIETVRNEANQLALPGIVHQATMLYIEVENRKEKLERERDEGQREQLLSQAHAELKRATDRRALERASDSVNELLTIERFKEEPEAIDLRNQINQQLRLYDATQKGLAESQQQMRQRRFQEAEAALRINQVSPLLESDYEGQRTLVRLLRQAGREQDRQEWQSAFMNYQQAIATDASLEVLLERDIERCRTRLTQQVLAEARTLLTATPPDLEEAEALLDDAEQAGWLEPTLSTDVSPLRQWIVAQKDVTKASEILEQEDGDPKVALTLLKTAQRQASDEQFKALISQWEGLAQALLAWRRGDLNTAERRLAVLPPAMQYLPRVQRLSEAVTQARRISSALEEAEQSIREGLAASPLRPGDAVSAVERMVMLAADDPRVQELRSTLRNRLERLMESRRQANQYDEAISLANVLLRLQPEDKALHQQVTNLPTERANRLDHALQQAEASLASDRLLEVSQALAQAAVIAAPQGDNRINTLRVRLEARQSLLEQVEQSLSEANALMTQTKWLPAIEKLEEAMREAPKYQPVVDARSEAQNQLLVLARGRLTAEAFDQATTWCELALRLSERDDLLALQTEIKQSRQTRLTHLRELVESALDEWELEAYKAPLAEALTIAPADPRLLRLEERASRMGGQSSQLTGKMEKGWNGLRQRNYPTARSAFDEVLETLGTFSEAQRWLDYTDNMQQAVQSVEADNFKQVLPLLRVAEGQVAAQEKKPLPAVLSKKWHERRRQAAYHAHQLAELAQELAHLEGQWAQTLDRHSRSHRVQALQQLIEKKEEFLRFHKSPGQVPDNFTSQATPVSSQPSPRRAAAAAKPSPIVESPAPPKAPSRDKASDAVRKVEPPKVRESAIPFIKQSSIPKKQTREAELPPSEPFTSPPIDSTPSQPLPVDKPQVPDSPALQPSLVREPVLPDSQSLWSPVAKKEEAPKPPPIEPLKKEPDTTSQADQATEEAEVEDEPIDFDWMNMMSGFTIRDDDYAEES